MCYAYTLILISLLFYLFLEIIYFNFKNVVFIQIMQLRRVQPPGLAGDSQPSSQNLPQESNHGVHFSEIYIFREDKLVFLKKIKLNVWQEYANLFQLCFKGIVSREFLPLFFSSIDSIWAPHEQAKTVLRAYSFSRKYSITKFENCVSAQSTITRTCKFSLRLPPHLNFFLNIAIGYVNTPKYFF